MADAENFSGSLQRPGRPGIQEIRDEFLGKFPFDAFSFDPPSVTNPRLILTGYRLMVGITSYGSKISEQLGAGVIEVGSNSNGTWIKFSDGTMICWHTGTTVTTSKWDIGGYYFEQIFTFPVPFITYPKVIAAHIAVNGVVWASPWDIGNGLTPTGCTIAVCSTANNAQGKPGYYAIGRWK